MVKRYRSTLQAVTQQPVNAGQQQQPGLARGSKHPDTNGAKLLTI